MKIDPIILLYIHFLLVFLVPQPNINAFLIDANIWLNKKACLLLDQHPSHTTKFVKDYALSKNIELIYIQKGYTYKYQPLDVGINGIIKQKSKAIWRKEKIKNTELKITNADGIKHLLTAISELTEEVIKKSFIKSCLIGKI